VIPFDLDDVRTRLAVAAADAAKALEEASQVARVVINDELRGQFTEAGLVTMKERLRVLRHALHDLEDVHADLRRRADAAIGHPAAQAPEEAPPVAPGTCQRCRREDAIVSVRVCMRCTDVARGEGARWMSGQPGPSAVMAGRTSVRVSRRRPP
jgi:hypothetical protein